MASPGVGCESALGSLGGRESMTATKWLCRAGMGVSAVPFNGWMVAVSGILKTNGPEPRNKFNMCNSVRILYVLYVHIRTIYNRYKTP